jgi:hypothetical protein
VNELIYYSPTRFNKLSNQDDVRLWLTLFKIFPTGISFVDRTGKIKSPVRTATLSQVELPVLDPSFNLSFKECAVSRAESIYKKHQQFGVPIRVGWSGGIDSSAALVSFIELLGVTEARKCLEIAMTSEGIIENPMLWEQLVLKENFKIVNTLHFTEQWDGSTIMVNGEGGDQIHGVDLYRLLIVRFGATALTMPWTESLVVDFIKFKTGAPDADVVALADIFISHIRRAPIEITTLADFWWWINFTCKWAATFYRIITKASTPISAEFIDNYFFPFYNSANFQLWSMYKREEKHQGTWATYKWKAKEFVSDFLGNDTYQSKHRQGSLGNVLSHSTKCEAIDTNFKFYNKIAPEEWYQSVNSFTK